MLSTFLLQLLVAANFMQHVLCIHNKYQNDKPNIVIILIDDLGFNDVSFHGSDQILTPNIDALAYHGIILNKHYTPNLCTPSRASLLTGKYPSHTGTQHSVIYTDEPWGLRLSERLMPDFFREAGYSTHLIGKWHLGFWRRELTPKFRGFNEHFGYYAGYIDYYDHSHYMQDKNYSRGLDLRRNLKPWPWANGTYATHLFTQEAEHVIEQHDNGKPLFLIMSHLAVHTGNTDNPMQAPVETVENYAHISDPKRRVYAAMVKELDDSVGRTMHALAQKGILNNTIVLFVSDNGAPTVGIHSNAGSNYPMRGQKESPWEGGIRTAASIYSPLLKQKNYVSNQVIHFVDWLPTLAAVAGVPLPDSLKLDGVNVWNILSHQMKPIPRHHVHVLDPINEYSAYTNGSWKYINGSSFDGKYDQWLGEQSIGEADPDAVYYEQNILSSVVHKLLDRPEITLTKEKIGQLRSKATIKCAAETEVDEMYKCEPMKRACLFKIDEDPCEQFNLALKEPQLLQKMALEVEYFFKQAVPNSKVMVSDPRADPALHNGTWQWWYQLSKSSAAPARISIGFFLFSLIFFPYFYAFR